MLSRTCSSIGRHTGLAVMGSLAHVPTGPGLGIGVDEEVVRAHALEPARVVSRHRSDL